MIETINKIGSRKINVGMGQTALLQETDEGRTVLGSCIGLGLLDERQRVAALAHVVLPRGNHSKALPAKFANTAIPFLLDMLRKNGCHRKDICAKIAGGANMLGGKGMMQIGAANHEAIVKLLQDEGIPITGEHVGGNKGRRIEFLPSHGHMTVHINGETSVVL